jgi:hypothetical protein
MIVSIFGPPHIAAVARAAASMSKGHEVILP